MKSLQECRSISEAQPLLRGSTPTFRKTVETAFTLMGHSNPQQQQIGQSFLNAAIQELDAAEEPTPKQGEFVKPKGEKFVKEADLAGGDKNGTEGSEQSSSNSGPTPKEGTEEPVGDLEQPEMSTENQMKESFGQPMPGQMPGLDPQIAQQLAPQMPQLPPMSTPQQVQQMQYTANKIVEAYIRPLQKQVIALTKANTFLSNQVREIQTLKTGLDLHSIDRQAPGIQEAISIPQSVTNVKADQGNGPRIYEKAYNLESEKQKIIDLDKMVSSSSNPYQ
jgi:hypothetical protein